MFRPYNFTSLAAWTFGSIAGNYAAAKGRQRLPRTISKACYPQEFIFFDDKLKKIGREINSLAKGLGKIFLGNEAYNFTPFVKMFAYNDWLQSQKISLKSEIERLNRENGSFPATILNFQNNVDSLVDHLDSAANDLRRSLDRDWGLNETDKKSLFDLMAKRQKLFQVNEITFKLVGFGAGRLLIKNRNST